MEIDEDDFSDDGATKINLVNARSFPKYAKIWRQNVLFIQIMNLTSKFVTFIPLEQANLLQ